ncbi:N-acyl amino acid synthase FeeM domain-containing protein [Desulfatitalea alkaliphila]|uniref:N-acyl amino acid synthase FeeM catalytic core domain-containing protein n=1 Tax=Desulfatitalea alkaliphila TaxID=2929485 RepID=A0AA41R408_9BACT|nr:hypothetical protein [Desulfatitalea alkaliphila]MCJ8498983.1 hypothetical protein [Desulfatitalea alkaliphila]
MVWKMMRKVMFTALRRSPKVLRDRVFRSRLNLKPLSRGLVFEIARSRSDLDKAFQLLHDAYVKEGFSKPHISGRRVTDYHALPSTTTLLAKCKEEVVATISVIRDGPFGLPADAVADFSGCRARGERLGEVSSLAINPRFRGRSGEVMFHLFKYMLHYSMYFFGLDRFVIVVNPNRITLYESILAFKRIPAATVRTYSFANNAPGVCATLDLMHLEQNFQRIYAGRPQRRNIYQFFFGPYSLAEKRQFRFPERRYYTAMDPVMSPDIMNYFFNQCTDFFCHLDSRKVGILRHIYQEQAYASVWPRHMFAETARDRGHRRFDVTCNAVIVGCSGEGSVLPVLDASRAGLRLRADMPLRYLDRSLLEVAVGRSKRARVVADCRWRNGATVGLRVVSADTDWHRFIDYMENRMARMAEAGTSGGADASAEPLAQMA